MPFFERKYLPEIILFVLAVVLYGNTLHHGFVLDDQMVLTKNEIVKKGIAGIPEIFGKDSFAGYTRLVGYNNTLTGGRYRPLSLGLFAIFYSVFGENALVFHALTIGLYALCGVVLYWLIRSLMKPISLAPQIAWLVAALFIAHPVHSEVVANIKGCDEILALLFGAAAWWSIFQYFDTRKKWLFFVAGIFFLLACLSKENAVMLAVTTPVSLWFFRKISIVNALKWSLPVFIALAAFLLIRTVATSSDPSGMNLVADPLNNIFLVWNGGNWTPCPFSVRMATIISKFGHQLSLLIFPYPLTHDYYHLKLNDFNEIGTWISLVMILLLTAYGVNEVYKRFKAPIATEDFTTYAKFGVLFLLSTLSLTSNIFFSVGAFMAERFLFLPSVGFCLTVVVLGITMDGKIPRNLLWAIYGIMILAFSTFTVLRNPAWKSDETMLASAFPYSAESPKLNNDYGIVLLEKALKSSDEISRKHTLETAFSHLTKAIENHPTYYDAFLANGACAYYLGNYEVAVSSYKSAYKLFPQDPKSKTGLQYALQAKAADLGNKKQFPDAIATMNEAWELQPDTLAASHLAKFYEAQDNKVKSLEWLRKALELMPNDARLQEELKKALE